MEQPNDLLQARTEAALLLRLDPSNLSPSDTLRCDLIASLRLVVDDASASVLDGRAPDLARLLTATESLIRLLPSEPPKPASSSPDPRQIMWQTYLGMRQRGEIGNAVVEAREVDRLRARVAELEVQLAERSDVPVEPAPTPAGSNVVPLKPPPVAASAAPEEEFEDVVVMEVVSGEPEPWRSFIGSDGSIMSRPGQKFWGPVGS